MQPLITHLKQIQLDFNYIFNPFPEYESLLFKLDILNQPKKAKRLSECLELFKEKKLNDNILYFLLALHRNSEEIEAVDTEVVPFVFDEPFCGSHWKKVEYVEEDKEDQVFETEMLAVPEQFYTVEEEYQLEKVEKYWERNLSEPEKIRETLFWLQGHPCYLKLEQFEFYYSCISKIRNWMLNSKFPAKKFVMQRLNSFDQKMIEIEIEICNGKSKTLLDLELLIESDFPDLLKLAVFCEECDKANNMSLLSKLEKDFSEIMSEYKLFICSNLNGFDCPQIQKLRKLAVETRTEINLKHFDQIEEEIDRLEALKTSLISKIDCKKYLRMFQLEFCADHFDSIKNLSFLEYRDFIKREYGMDVVSSNDEWNIVFEAEWPDCLAFSDEFVARGNKINNLMLLLDREMTKEVDDWLLRMHRTNFILQTKFMLSVDADYLLEKIPKIKKILQSGSINEFVENENLIRNGK